MGGKIMSDKSQENSGIIEGKNMRCRQPQEIIEQEVEQSAFQQAQTSVDQDQQVDQTNTNDHDGESTAIFGDATVEQNNTQINVNEQSAFIETEQEIEQFASQDLAVNGETDGGVLRITNQSKKTEGLESQKQMFPNLSGLKAAKKLNVAMDKAGNIVVNGKKVDAKDLGEDIKLVVLGQYSNSTNNGTKKVTGNANENDLVKQGSKKSKKELKEFVSELKNEMQEETQKFIEDMFEKIKSANKKAKGKR